MDHRNQARIFRDRAEVIRTLADIVTDETACAGYVALAQVYEDLAAEQDEQAGCLSDNAEQ